MIKRLIILACVLLMSSCGYFIKTVNVPVPVPCVEENKVPAEVENAKDKLRKDDPEGQKIKAILIEREQLRQADTTFRALIKACIK